MIIKMHSANPLISTLSFEGDEATEYTKWAIEDLFGNYEKCFTKNMNISEVYQKNTNKNPINFNWD